MSAVETLVAVVGAVLVVATLIDVVITVIGVSGGHGVVSRVVSRTIWRVMRGRSGGGRSHEIIRLAGPAIFVAITITWGVLLIGGWTLVFWNGEALSPTDDNGSIGWWDRIDHSTALVFGGSAPLVQSDTQPWSFAARIARFSGLGLSSFGLAYALPVVGAIVRIRRTANDIAAVAGADGRIETTAQLDGDDSVAHLYLINITSDVSDASQLTNAYPILPYFHSAQRSTSLPLQVARLNDYLARRDPERSSVPESVCAPLSAAIDSLLDVIVEHFLRSAPGGHDDRDERRAAIIRAWCRHDGWSDDELPDSLRERETA